MLLAKGCIPKKGGSQSRVYGKRLAEGRILRYG